MAGARTNTRTAPGGVEPGADSQVERTASFRSVGMWARAKRSDVYSELLKRPIQAQPAKNRLATARMISAVVVRALVARRCCHDRS